MVETFKINTNMDYSKHFAASENAFLNQLRENRNYLHDTDYHAFCSTVYNARKALMQPMSDYDFRIYDNAAIASDKARGMPNPDDSAWLKYHHILAAKERRDAQQGEMAVGFEEIRCSNEEKESVRGRKRTRLLVLRDAT